MFSAVSAGSPEPNSEGAQYSSLTELGLFTLRAKSQSHAPPFYREPCPAKTG